MNLADWGFRMPAAKPAVGHLDAPVATAVPSTSPAAARTPAVAVAVPVARHRSYVVQLALLCALALVAAFALSQRKLIVAAFRG